ncbi:hypothetical protein VNO78_09070 [Psophocarpus tetragonolobus]|uniref:Transmembrane protein n=1 Tax=Psophocarpus tetragonolobus TaxID=3891 RepID=A0AAN9SX58_PSOTE
MASAPLKFTVFSACVLILCVVVAAQYGEGGSYGSDMPSNMPGMQMGPAPPPNASPKSLSYPAIITILLPFVLTFLAANDDRIYLTV